MLDKMWSAKLERDVNTYQRMVGLGTAVSGDASCYDKGLVSGSSDFLWWLPCGSKGVERMWMLWARLKQFVLFQSTGLGVVIPGLCLRWHGCSTAHERQLSRMAFRSHDPKTKP